MSQTKNDASEEANHNQLRSSKKRLHEDQTDELIESPTRGPVVATFFRFVVPSVLSLLAISTASVIDGFFVGNYLGADALAAVNLLMPYLTLLFGIALMLAVGGSVKAGVALGKGEAVDASSIFSQSLIAVLILSVGVIPFVLLGKDVLFAALGAQPELFGLMSDYFGILCFAMVVQLCTLVIYYFIRADNYPTLGMQALLAGSASNIVLDALFIGWLEWGIRGAALATLLAQCVQLVVILRYFLQKDRNLSFVWPRGNWSVLLSTSVNGFSEFINEISVGIVVLVLHWVVSQQSGIEGIAAFSVINYLIFISLMVYYGIVDAMHGLLSQNFGAGATQRVTRFMRLSFISIASLGVMLVCAVHLFQDGIIEFFLDDDAVSVKAIASEMITLIWPVFLFNGFNVLICAYLTSAEKALQSSTLAMLRSLVLPIAFALLISVLIPGHTFIYAIPLAEGLTFILAVFFIVQFRPSRLAAAMG